jgi:hypothetical protein
VRVRRKTKKRAVLFVSMEKREHGQLSSHVVLINIVHRTKHMNMIAREKRERCSVSVTATRVNYVRNDECYFFSLVTLPMQEAGC